MKQNHLSHQFVEFIPETLQEGVLYISQRYSTAVHKCCCGCGQEVVTPLTPTDWSLIFDGKVVSLNPSIGNWSFPCRSHYLIKKSRVVWAGQMSQQQINRIRAHDRSAKKAYFEGINGSNAPVRPPSPPDIPIGTSNPAKRSIWDALKRWLNS